MTVGSAHHHQYLGCGAVWGCPSVLGLHDEPVVSGLQVVQLVPPDHPQLTCGLLQVEDTLVVLTEEVVG